MYKKTKKMIRKIQRSEDAVKKRWFFLSSGFSILFILAMWALYLSSSIPESKQVSVDKDKDNFSANFNSTFETFKNGLKNVSQDFSKQFGSFKLGVNNEVSELKDKIEASNEIQIKNDADMFPKITNDIPPTTLP